MNGCRGRVGGAVEPASAVQARNQRVEQGATAQLVGVQARGECPAHPVRVEATWQCQRCPLACGYGWRSGQIAQLAGVAQAWVAANARSKVVSRAFVDGAYLQNNDALAGEFRNEDMLSVGAGVELQLLSNFVARVDYGYALEKAGDDDYGHDATHLSFTILY